MSDSQRSDDRAPRSGAGDAARTQPIPRIPREGRPRTVADALREARSAPVESEAQTPQRRPGPARPAGREAGGSDAASPDPKPTTASGTGRTTSSKQASAPSADEIKKPASSTSRRTSSAATGAAAGRSSSSSRRTGSSSTSSSGTSSSGASSTASGSTTPTSASASAPAARESAPTAADYARTTGGSADSTSVMPAVKDEPTSRPATGGTSTRTGSSATTAATTTAPAPSSGGRQARLRLTFIEPWSVTRLAFVVSVALMIVAVVAVTIFWVVLEITGIWGSLNDTVLNVLSDSEGSFDLTDYLGLGRLVGLTLVLSAVNVVIMTAVATIGAHLYNLFAQLLGGIEVTFTDD